MFVPKRRKLVNVVDVRPSTLCTDIPVRVLVSRKGVPVGCENQISVQGFAITLMSRGGGAGGSCVLCAVLESGTLSYDPRGEVPSREGTPEVIFYMQNRLRIPR